MRGARIDFRLAPVGGGVRGAPVVSLSRLQRGRLILMIHGFNTTAAEAADGYAQFRDLVARQAPRLARQLCAVYWPGDSGLKGGGYPWLVERARVCGAMLGDWLAEQERDVVIIAHSLGCRLTLEALARLREHPGGPRIRVFLMAAAVPVGLVGQEERLAIASQRAASVDVLSSRTDGVLAFWFRLGQSVAPGEAHVLPEAVGLRGLPGLETWSRTAEMPGYDHGDYWLGQRAASHLAHRLGAAIPKPRPIRVTAPARTLPVRGVSPARPQPLASLPYGPTARQMR